MRRKKLKKALLAAFALAAAASYLEITGYKHFDAADGANVFCDLDPSCRQLTDGEVEKARKVFGDQIEYENVKVFNRPNYLTYPVKFLFGFSASAEAPNGNVYYIKDSLYTDDLSKERHKFPVLMHELTHVWQYQNETSMLPAAINAFKNADYDYNNAYEYDIDADTDFKDYNIEQQGEIIEEYIRLLNRYETSGAKNYWLINNCGKVRKYEQKIGHELPLTTFEKCRLEEPAVN